ncbi:hypothetical protein MJO28_004299 [Puccinia striiformis f. sp. tritici]|uniref:Uncharacterized protein n=1 Tax=Puccinia striiformis f. sp. tritici TaxID=168172 RepID=A0ACC0EP12_9BASI|nr:hypothetical protein Pst134EA_007103 [Puccinia striiformis f. sp. tritici]KAH9469826.1 hypothetical protein Pst134EA_007103 [Puccinia striiformis f. sp. tritici]KAI7957204.1 hypothetical protein MJO28_004299 [Puccinia striiformis f. sp. tritici]
MDSFMKLGQQAYKQYSDNQSHDNTTGGAPAGGNDFNVMGGAHLNRPAGGQMIDSDGDGIPDLEQAAAHASGNSGDSGDSSMFKSAISFIKTQSQKGGDDDDIDEEKVAEAHDRAYNQKQGSSLDAKSMGTAAALQAFKQFSSGGASNEPKHNEDGKSKLIGMAMAQAAKLFDSSGGAASGQKQDAVNSAGNMVMKLLMKQKLQQMTGGGGGGGGSGGGLGSLAGMIGKFAH